MEARLLHYGSLRRNLAPKGDEKPASVLVANG